MSKIKFDGRILILSEMPEVVTDQIRGKDVDLADALPLRNDVSTDEMTPQTTAVLYDDRLGAELLIAYKAGDEIPIKQHQIKDGGFNVVVAGKRYGKGSSREHSPLAHVSAGVKLIIAESFERIFRQNCDNLCIFTSTDFGLIERIRNGESFDFEELAKERDGLAKALLASGGLLKYGKSFGIGNGGVLKRPKTLVEKIVERHSSDGKEILQAGQSGFLKTDWRFAHDIYTAMVAHLLHTNLGHPAPLFDKEHILLFEDHLIYAHRSPIHKANNIVDASWEMGVAHRAFAEEYGIKDHGRLPDSDGAEGICHAIMLEQYALPGQVIVGTDSHTTHSGAMGSLAFGVGSTDMASAFATGLIRLTVPESILINLTGEIQSGITAKDIVLHLACQPELKQGAGVGKVFEFVGPVIDALSMDERATLTNMVAELGGFTGIIAPDQETVRFLKDVRGVDFEIEEWMCSDVGANYSTTINLDCTTIPIMVARPGDPGNGIPLSDLITPVKIDIAYGGSCTAGKREDFEEYFEVLDWAHKQGLGVASGVQLFLQYGTLAVEEYCENKGYNEVFKAMGVELLAPGCGACAGGGPGSSERSDQVTVSAINRNFPLRSGPGQVWLSNPSTVVASAIAGRLISFADLVKLTPNEITSAQSKEVVA